MEIKLCIFDLDDTLISTEALYTQAKEDAAEYLELLGFDFDETLETIRVVDRQRVAKYGVDKDRFPKSFVAAYQELCKAHGHEVKPHHEDHLLSLGYSVFHEHAPLIRGVKTTLTKVASLKLPMCILTRGDMEVQLKRSLDSGVAGMFSQIFVVSKKTPEVYDSICRFYGVDKQNAIMIGNSIAGDILPALEAELFALYLSNGTYELEGPHQISPECYDKLYVGKTVKELLTILGNIND